jgi:hypothetical protein
MYVCEKILSTFSPSFSVVVVVNSCISFALNISVDAFLSAASVEKKTSYSYKKKLAVPSDASSRFISIR